MSIFGVSMVRNEADVIEAFIRHNARYVDGFLIVDHMSHDDTPKILAALAAEGYQIQTKRFDFPSYDQAKIMTGLVRTFAGMPDVTHVFCLDADEFIAGDPDGLRAALLSRPALPVGLAWDNYTPVAGDDPGQPNPVRRITHRFKRQSQSLKAVIPFPLFGGIELSTGNHMVYGGSGEIPLTPLPDHRLCHLPVRSDSQLLSKIILGNWAMMLKADKTAEECAHWRWMSDVYTRNKRFDDGDIQAFFMTYGCHPASGLVADPIPSDWYGELAYTDPQVDLVRNMKLFVDELLSKPR
jgi:hypothetical protein